MNIKEYKIVHLIPNCVSGGHTTEALGIDGAVGLEEVDCREVLLQQREQCKRVNHYLHTLQLCVKLRPYHYIPYSVAKPKLVILQIGVNWRGGKHAPHKGGMKCHQRKVKR